MPQSVAREPGSLNQDDSRMTRRAECPPYGNEP